MKIGTYTTLLVVIFLTETAEAQQADSTQPNIHFSGSVSVTNKGISLIPSFTLGKPAAIINMSLGSKRLRFEPELRFSLEGKPWSYIFWGRYALVQQDRFVVQVGGHPAFVFRSVTDSGNGAAKTKTVTGRYLAGEIAPGYHLTKNVHVGVYYLYGHGLNEGTTDNTHFLRLHADVSNIRLTKQWFMRIDPQVYYLNMDQQQGVYMSASVALARKNIPLTLSAFVNKTISSEIDGSSMLWNASLTYAFN